MSGVGEAEEDYFAAEHSSIPFERQKISNFFLDTDLPVHFAAIERGACLHFVESPSEMVTESNKRQNISVVSNLGYNQIVTASPIRCNRVSCRLARLLTLQCKTGRNF